MWLQDIHTREWYWVMDDETVQALIKDCNDAVKSTEEWMGDHFAALTPTTED